MRIRIIRTKVASQTEWTVQIERSLSRDDDLRYAAESEAEYRTALRAIREAPDSAEAIARRVLDEDSDED